jgi:hypothetical protein
LNFKRLILGITFLAIFAMAVRVSVDSDTWWHLRAGSWMVENGRILRTDPFSLTRQAAEWEYPGWLAQIIIFGVYKAGGFGGLNLLTACMVVVAFAFVWTLTKERPLVKSFVIIVAVAASGVYWAARPYIFSFALTGFFLWVLEKDRAQPWRGLWLLPLGMALWVNLHGGFAIGFILIAAYLLGGLLEGGFAWLSGQTDFQAAWKLVRPQAIRLGSVGLVSALAAFLNPSGPSMLLYPFKTISIGVLQDYIQEWQSPNFHRPELLPFLVLILLTIIALAVSRTRKRPVEIVLVVGFLYMALMAGRNIAMYALVATPVLTRHLGSGLGVLLDHRPQPPQFPDRIAHRINLLLLVLVAIAVGLKIAVPLGAEFNRRAIADSLPVEAVAFIQEHQPPEELLNSYNWGGYITWTLYPDYPSFVDGRTDLFDDELLSRYLSTWRAEPGWEGFLDQWNVNTVLIEPEAPLAAALLASGWEILYQDNQAVLFTHR